MGTRIPLPLASASFYPRLEMETFHTQNVDYRQENTASARLADVGSD